MVRQIFRLLLLRQDFTLHSSKSLEEARAVLQAGLRHEITRTQGSGFFQATCRYHGTFQQDCLELHGPHGNRKWTLLTRGFLLATPQGVSLRLRLRPATWILVTTLPLLLLYVVFAIYTLSSDPELILIGLFQGFFLYGIILVVVRYEMSRVIQLFQEMLA